MFINLKPFKSSGITLVLKPIKARFIDPIKRKLPKIFE